MTIEQTITIPADNKIFLELPPFIPSGITALVKIDIPAVSAKDTNDTPFQTPFKIEKIRQLLQKEMADKGTMAVKAVSGDGWAAHARERYAEP